MEDLVARNERMLRLIAASFCALAIAIAVASWIASSPHVSRNAVLDVVVLGLLAALAANFEIEIRPRVNMSGHIMVAMASLVVCWDDRFFIGPLIVGAFSGLTAFHLQRREYSKVLLNSTIDGICLLVAFIPFWLIADATGGSAIGLVAAMASASLTYSVVDSFLLSIPLAASSHERYMSLVGEIAQINVIGFPFAFCGLGFGWAYVQLGFFVVPLLLIPVFIARLTFANYLKLKAAQEQTIETLITALEAKDRYTAGHAQRVALFCAYVGEELNFNPRRMERLRYAALMHDIGKLIVPNQLLNKPGRLTESEFERVKRHEFVSVELLRRIDFLAPIAGDTTTEAATAAVNGGLVEPAIIHVADAFDAMTSTRSYRRALPQATAFAELRQGAGSQFNEGCVDALIEAIERRDEHYGDGHEEDIHEWEVAPPETGTGSAGLGDLEEERTLGS
jgi:HD-GYP domain-containing protein (c-di-GMP phosphodiesterase class II)